jgi:hypothetical protein
VGDFANAAETSQELEARSCKGIARQAIARLIVYYTVDELDSNSG